MNLVEQLLDIIAPPTCVECGFEGVAICGKCRLKLQPVPSSCYRCGQLTDNYRVCRRCKPGSRLHQVWMTVEYEELAQKLISQFKFGPQRAAAPPMAKIVADFLTGQGLQKDWLVVHVPTATKRIRDRGFDHAGILANELARNLGLESANVLGRIGQSRQVGARRVQRLQQLKDNYYVRLPSRVKGKNILLIDDVITTGATLETCAGVLRAAGAKHVSAVVFARKPL